MWANTLTLVLALILFCSFPAKGGAAKCRELTWIPNLWGEKKKEEKIHAKKKQLHAQDNIYIIRQFVYVYGVAEILLLSGKNTKYWPKPSLHGLSLSKSLIKNHTTLFGLGQVVKLDQTKLDSTKPSTKYISC